MSRRSDPRGSSRRHLVTRTVRAGPRDPPQVLLRVVVLLPRATSQGIRVRSPFLQRLAYGALSSLIATCPGTLADHASNRKLRIHPGSLPTAVARIPPGFVESLRYPLHVCGQRIYVSQDSHEGRNAPRFVALYREKLTPPVRRRREHSLTARRKLPISLAVIRFTW